MPLALNTVIRWSLRFYLGYLLLCLLVLMPALNILAPRIVDSTLNRELRSELLLFNPFTLTLEARDVTIVESGGHEPLGFESLRINLSLESLWNPGVVLDAFIIEALDVHVLRGADGVFHFADLSSPPQEPETEASSAAIGLTIHKLLVEAHTLRFTDETRAGPYTTAQSDFRVRTENLTTVPDRQSNGDLVVTGDGGGTLRWRGLLEVHAGNSNGQITLEDIDLTPLWRYEAETLPFVVNGAKFSAVLNYQVDWNDELQATLSDSQLRFHDASISPNDTDALPNTSVELAELGVTGIDVDLSKSAIAVTALDLAGLRVSGFDEEGRPSLMAMFGLDPASQNDQEQSPTTQQSAPDTPADAQAPWQINLESFSLSESELLWRTAYLSPEVLSVSPINVQAKQIKWPAQANSPFSLKLAINDVTRLGITGDFNIARGDGEANVDLQQWPLPWLNPVLSEQAHAKFGRGDLSLQSNVQLLDFSPSKLRAGIKIEDYSTVLDATGEEAFTFQTLQLDGIDVDLKAQALIVDSILLQRPSGSLHIREDGTINVNGIVRSTPDDPTPSEPQESAEQSTPWRVQLANIALREGRLDFADASLPLHFKTLIDGIEADIKDVDTASEKPLNLEFKGSVDGYAPVVILGSGKPFAQQRDGELRFTFRGMDIATMSPYAGTYAGYTLDSGTLSLDLRYALDGQSLEGDNRIVISQMELGEPVESELAIDAPLKLGIALLTDSDGVIDLSVPISGDVDSPDFSLGPIIGRAITNIIVKAVTAPFSLLAGLVGSDDDLENVAFKAGSSSLDADARRAIDALGKALAERPQLSLQIAGGADPVNDVSALKESRLRTQFSEQGFDEAMVEGQTGAFLEALKARYDALGIQGDTGSNEDAVSKSIDATMMWRALVDNTALPSGALQDLATSRAAAAKRELVTIGGIDPARVSISFGTDLAKSGVQMIVDS
ncbi:DUF748 domain-containing protein [Congregibacter variabilis]|uniref:DUF748 domain-containing protein n=1 Tax=Congregibacter variabilis TaxID=3081200 RepID=A0ABZ0I2Z0_9GAMM|nr:DUF748 domain-containing protein [Congregibacter sp. IMCC43200]